VIQAAAPGWQGKKKKGGGGILKSQCPIPFTFSDFCGIRPPAHVGLFYLYIRSLLPITGASTSTARVVLSRKRIRALTFQNLEQGRFRQFCALDLCLSFETHVFHGNQQKIKSETKSCAWFRNPCLSA